MQPCGAAKPPSRFWHSGTVGTRRGARSDPRHAPVVPTIPRPNLSPSGLRQKRTNTAACERLSVHSRGGVDRAPPVGSTTEIEAHRLSSATRAVPSVSIIFCSFPLSNTSSALFYRATPRFQVSLASAVVTAHRRRFEENGSRKLSSWNDIRRVS